jgi:hypothetical protein
VSWQTSICTVALVGVLACEAVAAPRFDELRIYETPRFTLIADDDSRARMVNTQVAHFERVLVKVLTREMEPTGTPTYFFLVRNPVWARYLQPSDAVVGEFVPGRFSNYLLLNSVSDLGRFRQIVQHEFTHLFLRTQFRGEYPLWFDEGMAALMENTQLRSHRARIGPPRYVAPEPWISFARLASLDRSSPEYLSPGTSYSVLLESWGMMHMGLVAEPAFGDGIFRFIKSINDLLPTRDAVQVGFGMSVAEVDAKLREYLARDRFRVATIKYDPPPVTPLGPGRLLGQGEACEWLARTMLDLELNSARVREVVDAAVAASPGSPGVGVLEMRLAVRDRDDAALERHYQTLADTKDAATARGMGLALFERARNKTPADSMSPATPTGIARRAFVLLDRALVAEPGDGEATWAYALLAAQLGENLETALSRLAFTRTLVRDNSDLAMVTALVHEAGGNLGAMVPFLEEAARFANSAEKRRLAHARIAEIRKRMSSDAPL